MSGLTRTLGAFVAARDDRRPSQAACEQATRGFVDCIATMMAGHREPAVRILASVHGERAGPAAVFLGRSRASAATAALLNGTAAHALDFDDVGAQSENSH